jgi:cytochrome c oxidase cbb3-type subunit IV
MHFDFDMLSSAITVVWFVAFVALCFWAWSDRRRKDYDAAAKLPFDEPGEGES